MFITFQIDCEAAQFSRNWFTGRAELRVGSQTTLLQCPLAPETHVEFSMTRVWRVPIGKHEIKIEKVRPLFFAGLRPQNYRVWVDGKLVAEKQGY